MKKPIFVTLLIALLLLSACRPGQPTPILPTPAVTAPSLPPPPTASPPAPTVTVTRTATRVPTPTATVSLTPLPTLPAAEYQQLTSPTHLMRAKCALPFWGAITPGVTSWPEAAQFFTQLSVRFVNKFGYSRGTGEKEVRLTGRSLVLLLEGEEVVIGGIATLANEEVAIVRIAPDPFTTECRLYQLLALYGPPDEVYLRAFANPPEPYYPVDLVLVFDQPGLLAHYLFEAAPSGDVLRACPGVEGPTIFYWGESSVYRQLRASFQEDLFGPDSRPMKALEDTTGLTIEQFYEQFRDSAAGTCLETEAEHW